jgi:hypothetical protein
MSERRRLDRAKRGAETTWPTIAAYLGITEAQVKQVAQREGLSTKPTDYACRIQCLKTDIVSEKPADAEHMF